MTQAEELSAVVQTGIAIHREVLNGLVASGAAVGDLAGESGAFLPWDSSDPLTEAARRWGELDHELTIGDVGWLARA